MSTPSGIRAISFDLDDTFWDCAPAINRAEAVLTEWLRKEVPAVLEYQEQASLTERRDRLLAHQPELSGDVTALRKRMLADLFTDAGQPASLVEEAFSVFYRARSEVVLYDGVLPLLDALRPRYKVAAITNGNADLDYIGIADRFDLILRASLDLPAKPADTMFCVALEAFGIAAHEMLHVGDSVTTDVAGAQRAGVGAVWFNPTGHMWREDAPRPDFTVASIDQLHELLI